MRAWARDATGMPCKIGASGESAATAGEPRSADKNRCPWGLASPRAANPNDGVIIVMATQSLPHCSSESKPLLPTGGTPARRASRLRAKLNRVYGSGGSSHLGVALSRLAEDMRDIHPDHWDAYLDRETGLDRGGWFGPRRRSR